MEPKPGSEEAPKDPGVLTTHHSYNETDFDGHRQHAMYVGFHVPGGYRRRGHHHRRHHRHHHRNGGGKREGEDGDNRPVTPPAERVHFILGQEEDQDGQHMVHPLFSELEELVCTGDAGDGDMEWRERARWIKFEEDVEEGGDRWSKPHVATISLHSLFELRSCILNGCVMLDLEAASLDQIADLVLENMVNAGQLRLDLRDRVKENLLRRHRHQHEKRHDKGHHHKSGGGIPNIRSLVDIGRNSSRSMFGSHRSLDKLSGDRSRAGSPFASGQSVGPSRKTSTISQTPMTAPPAIMDWRPNFAKYIGNLAFADDEGKGGNGNGGNDKGQLPQSNSASSLNHLAVGGGGGGQNHSASMGSEVTSSSDLQHKANQAFMKKVPPGSEADNILVGELDFLDRSISAFVRLSAAAHLGDLTEVPVPTRFLFILLGPKTIPGRYHEIGRSMATLMSDEVFHEIAYKAKNRQDLLAGVDEFLDAVTILPPGAWDPSIRIEPPQTIPSQDARKKDHTKDDKPEIDSEEEEEKEREKSGLVRSGRLFGGLINDVKRKTPWYWSDFRDAFALQSLASIFFLYFACLAPIITFGGLLGEATGQNIATMESLLTGAICGIMYGLFSGQPLTILGSTGPVLVFETIMFDFCSRYGFTYLAVRMWIGLWMASILFAFVAFDASSLVCYITRFTEENFATLISVIFIYKAVENVLAIGKANPMRTRYSPTDLTCSCRDDFSTTLLSDSPYRNDSLFKSCLDRGGQLVGPGCQVPQYVPDVFLFSFILFLFTYIISVILKDFKAASFFPAKVRAIVSDFAVVIAIFSMTFVDYMVGIATPKLIVPQEFKPTSPHRDWFFHPFPANNPWWTPVVCLIPALLATILIFMDQQITAVIINRKENKLKKGCGYHLDLLIVAILVAICSIMGLPWFVAATVLSMTHVNSLRMESECAAPGEKPQFLGVREQRVTHVVIFVLVGVSVFLTNYLKHIPMPVLFGVFLYMGTSSLTGSQMFARCLILFMPQKYQPDYIFLRQVRIERVHMFTAIQLLCFAGLWIIKSYKPTSIAFPLMLVVIIGVRKLLDFVFTRRELKILDDVMPEHTRRAIEDQKKEEDKDDSNIVDTLSPNTKGLASSGSSGNVAIPLANGNILKIAVDKYPAESTESETINISEQLAKSSAWKTIEQKNPSSKSAKTSSAAKSAPVKNRTSGKDALTVEEQKRLSTMNEDDEDDCGITIRIDGPTPVPSSHPSAHTSPTEEGKKAETRV